MGLLKDFASKNIDHLLAPEFLVYVTLDTALERASLALSSGQAHVSYVDREDKGEKRLMYEFVPSEDSLGLSVPTHYPAGCELSAQTRAESLPSQERFARIGNANSYTVGAHLRAASPSQSMEGISFNYELSVSDRPRLARGAGDLLASGRMSATIILKPTDATPRRVPFFGWRIGSKPAPNMDERLAKLQDQAQQSFKGGATYTRQGPSLNIYFQGSSLPDKIVVFETFPGFLDTIKDI